MKYILLAIALILLGCGKTTTDSTASYSLPDGLSDCKIYELENEYGNRLYLARCPLSETAISFRSGKVMRHTTTIELDTAGFGEYKRLKEKFEK